MFAEILQNHLTKNNISPHELFKSFAVPREFICDWLLGVQEPDFTSLVKIADYLDVSVDYLLGRTDNSEVNR